MRVVILSAGRGTRMLPLTRNTPKALLDLGHGITVIESQLNSIRDAGVKEVSLVLGFLAEQVEAKVRVDQPHAVGPDQPHAGGARRGNQLRFTCRPLGAGFGKA